jgi:hypothetical protein
VVVDRAALCQMRGVRSSYGVGLSGGDFTGAVEKAFPAAP